MGGPHSHRHVSVVRGHEHAERRLSHEGAVGKLVAGGGIDRFVTNESGPPKAGPRVARMRPMDEPHSLRHVVSVVRSQG